MEKFKQDIEKLQLELNDAIKHLYTEFDVSCVNIENVLYMAKELYLQMRKYEED